MRFRHFKKKMLIAFIKKSLIVIQTFNKISEAAGVHFWVL